MLEDSKANEDAASTTTAAPAGSSASPTYRPLQPQPTEAAPYVVADYPYGFRLRCQIRYWVETTKYGQRLVSQTQDPRNGRWNKPKASTYSNIVLAAFDELDHVVNIGYSVSYSSAKKARAFREAYGQALSPYQQTELTNGEKMLEVYDKVEWSVNVQKFKNVRTGEITTSVSMFDLRDVVKVNDLGDPVDEKAEKSIDRDITRAVNLAAIKNAAAATSTDEALKTFKRSVA